MPDPVAVYVETAPKRSFAGAIDWPGWTRAGRTAEGALAALAAYRDRYAAVLRAASLPPPAGDAPLDVRERLAGGSGTEFGVPSASPSADDAPLDRDDVERLVLFMDACWAAFDRAVAAAGDLPLATGPRGGGRDVGRMVAHVADAERAYLGVIGADGPAVPADPAAALAPLHAAARAALAARARGELPEVGARGGRRWTGRYFVRRVAWHVLDHAWEIEDRAAIRPDPT